MWNYISKAKFSDTTTLIAIKSFVKLLILSVITWNRTLFASSMKQLFTACNYANHSQQAYAWIQSLPHPSNHLAFRGLPDSPSAPKIETLQRSLYQSHLPVSLCRIADFLSLTLVAVACRSPDYPLWPGWSGFIRSRFRRRSLGRFPTTLRYL